MITNYIGKTIGNRVLVICKDKDGNYIQTPHIDYMKKDGLVMIGLTLKEQKNGLRYLTQEEIACFMTGRGTDGQILETPTEMRERHEKSFNESMKDPKFRAIWEELQKEIQKRKAA